MSEPTLAHTVVVPDAVVWRMLGGETVVMQLETGIYFGLDQMATAMWTLMSERGSLGAVHESLLAQYDVDAATLESDLLALVRELVAKGLLELGPGSST